MRALRAAALLCALSLAFAASIEREGAHMSHLAIGAQRDDHARVARAPTMGIYQLPVSKWAPGTGVPLSIAPTIAAAPHDNEFENYYERMGRTWYNYARVAPLDFRDRWMSQIMNDKSLSQVFSSTDYTKTPLLPIPYDVNMNRLARAHAADRLTCPPSQGQSPHYDCNNTAPGVRMQNYVGLGTGEIYFGFYPSPPNRALGAARIFPFMSMAGFVCDGYGNGAFQIGACCTDHGSNNVTVAPLGCGSGGDGHRSLIMTANGAHGCGWGWTASHDNTIMVCNQVGTTNGQLKSGWTLPYTHVVYSGGHYFDPKNTTRYAFLANIYTNNTRIDSAVVNIAGKNEPLTLLSGSDGRGNYVSQYFIDPATSLLPSSTAGCKPYFFSIDIVKANGDKVNYRYPTSGYYYTYYVNGCNVNWANPSDPAKPPNPADPSTWGLTSYGGSGGGGSSNGVAVGVGVGISLAVVVAAAIGFVLWRRSRGGSPMGRGRMGESQDELREVSYKR